MSFFSAGWHLMPKMPVHNRVQNISRNQLAGEQWCCPKCSLRHQTTVLETKFRSDGGCWTVGLNNTTVSNWKTKGHCNTFGSSLTATLQRYVGAFMGFVETSLVCEWRGLAQSFIHSRTRSHGADALMRWIPHLLRWGSVNLNSLWRIRHLSACSDKRHNTENKLTTKSSWNSSINDYNVMSVLVKL